MPFARKAILACLASASLVLVAAPGAYAAHDMQAMFQDDNQLIYTTPAAQSHTLDILKSLGVQRIRVTIVWRAIAPSPMSASKPSFNAADPAEYPPGAWDHYDSLVKLAVAHNIKVNFNPTAPAPNWATGTPDRADIDQTFDPNPKEFGLFMVALARRYTGLYKPPGATVALPRVNYWSIWNEPNQAGWLTPQWAIDPRPGAGMVETAPQIYRSLVDAAWTALQGTGHAKDTILIGETAPKGSKGAQGETKSLDALAFIRELYCVDKNLQIYIGSSATVRGCPVGADARQKFVSDHPGLFQASGWAHHPYELIFSPNTKPGYKDWATIANLPALSKLLRRVHQRYGQTAGNGGNIPLYLTEFGYQTNPPDPLAVSPAHQAAWINQAEYIAYSNKYVRTLSQFLLVDDKPLQGVPTTSPSAWTTFQSGLVNLNGSHKPSFDAYRFPIYLPHHTATRKGRLRVWGNPRMAGGGLVRTVVVEARQNGRKAFKKIGQLKTDELRGYVDGRVTVHHAGVLRLRWQDPVTKAIYRSRVVPYALAKKH